LCYFVCVLNTCGDLVVIQKRLARRISIVLENLVEHTEASHSIQIARICRVAFAHYTIVALNRCLVMRMSGLCDRNGMAYIEITIRELTAENSFKNRCR
jgi:hypothetical protein